MAPISRTRLQRRIAARNSFHERIAASIPPAAGPGLAHEHAALAAAEKALAAVGVEGECNDFGDGTAEICLTIRESLTTADNTYGAVGDALYHIIGRLERVLARVERAEGYALSLIYPEYRPRAK